MREESPAGQLGLLAEGQCAVSVTHSLKIKEIQGSAIGWSTERDAAIARVRSAACRLLQAARRNEVPASHQRPRTSVYCGQCMSCLMSMARDSVSNMRNLV